MLIPSHQIVFHVVYPSLSRRVNANSQRVDGMPYVLVKLIKKGEC